MLLHGCIGYGDAARLYTTVADTVAEAAVTSGYLVSSPSVSNSRRVSREILGALPLIKLPFHAAGQAGRATAVLVPNVPSISAEDLPRHLAPM